VPHIPIAIAEKSQNFAYPYLVYEVVRGLLLVIKVHFALEQVKNSRGGADV
jgi:hypothetical protein